MKVISRESFIWNLSIASSFAALALFHSTFSFAFGVDFEVGRTLVFLRASDTASADTKITSPFAFPSELNVHIYIMAKRKRNQQAAPANNQNAAPSPSKKPKVVDETIQNAGPKEKPASSKPIVASNKSKHETVGVPEKTNSEPAEALVPVQSSSSLKRERKRKRLRELKKNALSADKTEDQKAPKLAEQEPLPEELSNAAVKNKLQSAATLPDKKSAKSKAHQSENPIEVDSPTKPAETKKDSLSDATLNSKNQDGVVSNKKATGRPSDTPATQKLAKEQGEVGGKPSKKQLRRRKAFEARQAAASNDGQQQVDPSPNSNDQASSQAKSLSSTSKAPKTQASSSDGSLLSQTTKTHLLPRPVKQWVEQDDVDQDGRTTTNDEFTSHETGNSILGPLANALQGSLEQSSPAQTKTTPLSKNQSTGPVNELPSFLATVGVPSTKQTPNTVSTPLARPGINTIASFSLSSRRHPASILAKQRTISGLSGMRMDTGMIGSSPKPVSANKANSVPSYAGNGDVKAAFNRFNKFAHGGNSSASDDDSDESDKESNAGADITTKPVAVQPVERDLAELSATPSKSTSEPRAAVSVPHGLKSKNDIRGEKTHDEPKKLDMPPSGLVEANNTVRTNDPTKDRVSDSADSSESNDEASEDAPMEEQHPKETTVMSSTSEDDTEAQEPHEETLAQPLNNAPRMLGEKDLPLFSDFNAKHNIIPTDTAIARSANFLERELGGAPSGFGQTDDSEIHFIDYVASQDADDLYRSVDDISREVFGSTREIPDCKPLLNYLDVASERFVTDEISNRGLGRKSAELETTLDKTTVLSSIVRGSSLVVYIAYEMDIGTSTVLNDGDEGHEEQDDSHEEQSADHGPSNATQKAKLDRSSSPSSSLDTLTPSPTPSETVPENIPADTNSNEIEIGEEEHERLSSSNSPIPVAEVKKRKLTGITSKHFSPRKSLPRVASARVESASKYAEDVMTHDTDEEIEQSTSSDDLSEEPLPSLKPSKKKGTGKKSTYFTPTSSPAKSSDTKKTTHKSPRPPKGTSSCLVPSTNSTHFGLIQEKLWKEPFWLIIAVTFLNKTAGRAAAPIFWRLKELYPTPEALSQAKEEDLVPMIGTLGLQNQRAKRLVLIAKAWLANPPAKNQRYRTLHYPAKGDGKALKKDQIVEEDADDCAGALEIGHIPGCGPYAWDSWRIFCRDVRRGIAQDYNGRLAGVEDFEPEWQRVVPLDKELRACLRWMWLREGFVWDHESGEKRDATLEEMEAGLKGEMEIADEQEQKFAREAAGVDDVVDDGGLGHVETVVKDESGDDKKESVSKTAPAKKAAKVRPRKMSIARRELDVGSDEEVAVSTVRRSRRNKAGQRSP
jgi:methyl-CpG-binding domain protein 4